MQLLSVDKATPIIVDNQKAKPPECRQSVIVFTYTTLNTLMHRHN